MIQANLNQFFDLAQERYRMMLRKEKWIENPYRPHFTADPHLRVWRFCNTFREDDKTTKWFVEKLREPLRNDAYGVLLATVAFRWFNRIETGEILLPMLLERRWDSAEAKRLLANRSPVVTGAYIIKTPNGMTKLDGVCWCIDEVAKDAEHLAGALEHDAPDERSLQGTWECLKMFPYLGDFMAYQIISDLRHTCWLDQASDAMSWAALGPGSTRGCGWIEANNPDHFKKGKASWEVMQDILKKLVQEAQWAWPDTIEGYATPTWEAQTVQHWLCEYDKYRRAAGGQEMKRRYA